MKTNEAFEAETKQFTYIFSSQYYNYSITAHIKALNLKNEGIANFVIKVNEINT